MAENQKTGQPPEQIEITRAGRGQLVEEIHRLRGLIDQTQTKLESETADRHRLEQENIGIGRDIERLERDLTQADVDAEKRGERVARTS